MFPIICRSLSRRLSSLKNTTQSFIMLRLLFSYININTNIIWAIFVLNWYFCSGRLISLHMDMDQLIPPGTLASASNLLWINPIMAATSRWSTIWLEVTKLRCGAHNWFRFIIKSPSKPGYYIGWTRIKVDSSFTQVEVF